MASSSEGARLPQGFIPSHVEFILNKWKPSRLSVDVAEVPQGAAPKKAKTTSGMVLSTRTPSRMVTSAEAMPPPAVPSSAMNISAAATAPLRPSRTAGAGSTMRGSTTTRAAGFYDKHLAKHLTLQKVQRLDSLIEDLARTVDDALWNAYEQRKSTQNPSLPQNGSRGLKSPEDIEELEEDCRTGLYRERGVEERYRVITPVVCLPVAAVLAVHPLVPDSWRPIMLEWTLEVKPSKCAIPDGALHFRWPTDPNERAYKTYLRIEPYLDDRIRPHMEELSRSTLATWEMKSLTVGRVEVFNKIREMKDFHWKRCMKLPENCKRLGHEAMTNGPPHGCDALIPFWTPQAETPARSIVPLPVRRSESIGRASAAPSYPAEPSGLRRSLRAGPSAASVPVTVGETGKDRKRKRQADLEPEPESESDDSGDDDDTHRKVPAQEMTARSLVQQAWAQTVYAGNTILVLHSGNHEIVGVRHRASRTLYVSDIIEPWNCQCPGYGKIQVGIYIAAIRDAVDRLEQDKAQDALERENQSAQTNVNGHAPDSQDKEDDRPPPKNPERRSTQGTKQGGATGSVPATEFAALVQKAATCNVAFMHFRYDVFFSPRPATFVRETTQGTNIPTDSENFLVIVFDSELEPGSTGVVHTGMMDVTPSEEKIPIAVKLAFSDDDKLTLKHEYTIYSHLQSGNVPGIPQVFGLFIDAELIYGNEGPYALIMSFAGPALYRLPKDIPTITKRSLVTTLQKIHEAGVIHGDLSLANICINDGRGFIIDFTHARLRGHPREQAAEMEELHTLLKLETSVMFTKRKIAEVDTTNLRRSTRLRYQVQDSELAKRRKIEARVFPAEVAPAKQATLKKVTARKPAARKAAMTSPTTKASAAKKTPAKRAPAKTTLAKKTAAKRATATKVTVIKTTTTRPTAKTSAAKKTPVKLTPANKTPAKETAENKTAVKRTPAKRTPAKRTPAKETPPKTPAMETPPKTPAETSRTRSGRSSRPTRK